MDCEALQADLLRELFTRYGKVYKASPYPRLVTAGLFLPQARGGSWAIAGLRAGSYVKRADLREAMFFGEVTQSWEVTFLEN